MEIKKKKGKNDYTFSGLTLGKFSAMRQALIEAENNGHIGPVGHELKMFLDNHLANDPIMQTKNIWE